MGNRTASSRIADTNAQLPRQLELDLQAPKTAVATSGNAGVAPSEVTCHAPSGDNAAEPLLIAEDGAALDAPSNYTFSPDEFGPLANFVPPGEDPSGLHHVLTQLASRFQPLNFADALLIHDIGRQTIYADYLWQGQMEGIASLMEDTARELAAEAPSGTPASKLDLAQRLRGRAFIAHHAVMTKLSHMHGQVQNSRNKTILALENKRLMDLKVALAAAGGDD